jgi:CDP-diacylglycerol--serine O-phosphatidyltransferase
VSNDEEVSAVADKVRERWQLASGKWRIRSIRGGKWWRERGKKGISAIPHLFTLLNLAFGVGAIMLATSGKANHRYAALMVIGSLVADGLDGRLARMLKADGEFGRELDSLADVVAFGTAPAILLYELGLNRLGLLGVAVTIIFTMSGALRLAKFNIIRTSGFFLGVPITAAGTFLSCLAFYWIQPTTTAPTVTVVAGVMLVLSYLMISSIPYPDFKKRKQSKGQINIWPAVGPLLAILLVLAVSGFNPWALVLVPLLMYIVLGPWLLLIKKWAERVQPWMAGTGRR